MFVLRKVLTPYFGKIIDQDNSGNIYNIDHLKHIHIPVLTCMPLRMSDKDSFMLNI